MYNVGKVACRKIVLFTWLLIFFQLSLMSYCTNDILTGIGK